jgi:hypothetical protein
MFDESSPIFQQLADRIADDVLAGTYAEEQQVASTNEFAAFYRINPATACTSVEALACLSPPAPGTCSSSSVAPVSPSSTYSPSSERPPHSASMPQHSHG